MSWGKIYCDTNWGENKYRTAGSIINEATPDCFQFPEFVTFKDHVRTEGATYEQMQCGIDILLFLGRSISITPKSPDNPTFSGILDTYTGATAGYSTRRLTNTYTGGLIRVRRSSDDTEQDIGYDANGEDLDTFGLLAFVNADVDVYTSDFSSTEDLAETNGTGAAAQSVGGVDDAYKFTTITGTGQMFANISASPFSGKGGGNEFRVQADLYLPSTNAEIDGVRIWTGYGTEIFADVTTTDSWISVDQTLSLTQGGNLYFSAKDGADLTPTTTGANVFYLKNIVVTQTTADGHITTWYDQTGNGNNATNSTASEQPLIVDGGSIIYEGATISRPAIEFDGSDDNLSQSLANDFYGTKDIYLFAITKNASSSETGGITQKRDAVTTGNFGVGVSSGKYQIQARDAGTGDAVLNSVNTYDTQQLLSVSRDSSGLEIHSPETRSVSISVADLTSSVTSQIGTGNSYGNLAGNIQELIIFTSDQSTNRTGIEGNIDNYFRITP